MPELHLEHLELLMKHAQVYICSYVKSKARERERERRLSALWTFKVCVAAGSQAVYGFQYKIVKTYTQPDERKLRQHLRTGPYPSLIKIELP